MSKKGDVKVAFNAAEVDTMIPLCRSTDKAQFAVLHGGQIFFGDFIPFIIGNENFRNGFEACLVVEIKLGSFLYVGECQRLCFVVVVIQSQAIRFEVDSGRFARYVNGVRAFAKARIEIFDGRVAVQDDIFSSYAAFFVRRND